MQLLVQIRKYSCVFLLSLFFSFNVQADNHGDETIIDTSGDINVEKLEDAVIWERDEQATTSSGGSASSSTTGEATRTDEGGEYSSSTERQGETAAGKSWSNRTDRSGQWNKTKDGRTFSGEATTTNDRGGVFKRDTQGEVIRTEEGKTFNRQIDRSGTKANGREVGGTTSVTGSGKRNEDGSYTREVNKTHTTKSGKEFEVDKSGTWVKTDDGYVYEGSKTIDNKQTGETKTFDVKETGRAQKNEDGTKTWVRERETVNRDTGKSWKSKAERTGSKTENGRNWKSNREIENSQGRKWKTNRDSSFKRN